MADRFANVNLEEQENLASKAINSNTSKSTKV